MTTDTNQPTSAHNVSRGFGQGINAPAPIICTAKCSSSALKDIFGKYNIGHGILKNIFIGQIDIDIIQLIQS